MIILDWGCDLGGAIWISSGWCGVWVWFGYRELAINPYSDPRLIKRFLRLWICPRSEKAERTSASLSGLLWRLPGSSWGTLHKGWHKVWSHALGTSLNYWRQKLPQTNISQTLGKYQGSSENWRVCSSCLGNSEGLGYHSQIPVPQGSPRVSWLLVCGWISFL